MGAKVKFVSLRGWSVSAKISFGFAIVLLLHISIAVIAHYGLRKADEDRSQQDRLRSQVELFHDIDRIVGELQRNVLLFAYAGVKGPELRVVDIQNQLSGLLAEASQAGDTTEDGTISTMQSHLTTHRDIFEVVLTDRAKRRQLLDMDMVQYVEEFNAELEALRALVRDGLTGSDSRSDQEQSTEKIANHFQAAQLHAMRFVHSPDSSHVRNMKRELGGAKATLAFLLSESEDVDQQRLKAVKVLEQYEDCCIQMVQATRGYLHLTNVVLAGEAKELSYLAGQARQLYSQRAEQLSEQMAVDSGHFSRASTMFSLITIVIGVLASWAIQKDFAPGLNAITQTFEGLVRGEKFSTIPGKERRDELGSLAAAAQVFRDKAALTEELLEGVRELRELDRAHAHSQKLESLGQLAAGIAHEINTPLQCVAANVEFLEASYETLTTIVEQCCELLDVAASDQGLEQSQLERLHTLQEAVTSRRFEHVRRQAPLAASEAADAVRRVVEIIVATKAISHPGAIELIDCDLNELIHHSATLSRNRWKDVAELKFELSDELPRVPLQPAELSQVLLNLIVNASDAIAESDRHGNRSGEIVVRSFVENECIIIEVQDNGPGIPEKVIERIFDPFFTTKEVGKGTGQGLSISYDIVVHRLRGHISVHSDNSGARFCVKLPLVCPVESSIPQMSLENASA